MTFGGALSLVLLATLPRLLLPISRRRWWPIPLWLVSFLTLAITRVRGAWLGFLAGVLVQAGLLRRRGAALIGAIGVLAAASLLVPLVRERAATIADLNFDSTVDRLQMWTAGLAILRDHPIVGVGPGQVKRVFPQYSVPDAIRSHTGHVHSTPLQILIERGVLGFVAWGAIFVGFLARALRVLRELPPEAEPERALVIGSIGSIAGFLVGGLTEYNFGDSEVAMIAYCIMAMPFVVDAASRVATKAGSRRGGDATRMSETP
jgi:O-antigen ligase